jgi:hypothetical protein
MPKHLASKVVEASQALDDQDTDPTPLVEEVIGELKQGFV